MFDQITGYQGLDKLTHEINHHIAPILYDSVKYFIPLFSNICMISSILSPVHLFAILFLFLNLPVASDYFTYQLHPPLN